MTINAHKRDKDYYGGETMPEGMRDCNSCGWYGEEKYFAYGLCSSCGPDDSEDDFYESRYDSYQYKQFNKTNDLTRNSGVFYYPQSVIANVTTQRVKQ